VRVAVSPFTSTSPAYPLQRPQPILAQSTPPPPHALHTFASIRVDPEILCVQRVSTNSRTLVRASGWQYEGLHTWQHGARSREIYRAAPPAVPAAHGSDRGLGPRLLSRDPFARHGEQVLRDARRLPQGGGRVDARTDGFQVSGAASAPCPRALSLLP
jgi:hypothetical protein